MFLSEARHVPRASQSEREAEHGRSHAERDHIRKRIEVAAEHRPVIPVQARDVSIEHVADERHRQQRERVHSSLASPAARESTHRKIAIVPQVALPIVNASAGV